MKIKMKMKKIKMILVIVVTTLTLTSIAQNSVEKGTIVIDGFYGLPYWNGAALKSTYGGTIHNINHIGAKVEYLVTDQVGLGIEFTYADAYVNYQSGLSMLWYKAGISKYRIIGRMNYHFATTEEFDPYFAIGVGIKQTNVYSTEPGAGKVNVNLVPVAFRIGLGGHYYFNDILGLNAEVGLGGPIIHLGLSCRF